MASKPIFILLVLLILSSCSKDKPLYEPKAKVDPYTIYNEGFNAFKKNDFFFASKKFSEAELNFISPELSAKSALMASFSLYAINFYNEAIDNLERYILQYPADKNLIYAQYLICIIYFEQIDDEKKDIEPALKAKEKILFFLEKYPNTEYALDLKFKKDLIQNQLAAKELYVAKYFIKTKKWASAIKRLKIIYSVLYKLYIRNFNFIRKIIIF